jgi:monoamine oxidase
MPDSDVIVIGAGAAGIAAARRLRAANVAVRVIEARERVGGRAFTHVVDGIPLDLGCGWLHSADENDWAALAGPAGFTVDKTEPPWRRGGSNLGFTAGEHADFRRALERFYERMDRRDADAADFAASNLLEPGGRWNPLIDAISTWINGVETDRVSVRDWNRYRDTEVNWRIREGYGALVAAHAADLDVTFGAAVTMIDHAGSDIRVETARGVLTARSVVVTAPTNVIAAEALRFSPALPDKLEAAAGLPLGHDDKLFLAVEAAEDLPHEDRLFGSIDGPRIGSYHFRPFGRPLIECYFGGALARDLEAEGDAAFVAFATEQLAGYFGASIRRRLSPLAVSAWGRDPFARGAYSHALPGKSDLRAVLAAPVENRLFFAGEACSTHDFSTAHGAFRTGIAAADAALAALPRPGSAR